MKPFEWAMLVFCSLMSVWVFFQLIEAALCLIEWIRARQLRRKR